MADRLFETVRKEMRQRNNSHKTSNAYQSCLRTFVRHTFATRLLERGIDLRFIQESLGNTSPKTTDIYSRVSKKSLGKIISPFGFCGSFKSENKRSTSLSMPNQEDKRSGS